jgi:hypothetical protein
MGAGLMKSRCGFRAFCLIGALVLFGAKQVLAAPASQDANNSTNNGSPHHAGSDAEPPVQRTVIHSEAYKKREGLGPHIEIKVTPPEERGRKGFLLVEVYNYSKTYLALAEFNMSLSNKSGENVEAHITCEDIKGGWSALKWVRIPGNRSFPLITKVSVANLKMITEQAREVKLKYFVDLIKK